MNPPTSHAEHHMSHRTGWLRAAVLGANDGIVSTASLIVGVAAAAVDKGDILLAGVAALVAGAGSMAAGEYVSVSSQADTERADIETEKRALRDYPKAELRELADIYVERGLERDLAVKVAEQLMAHDALEAHKRDELGITSIAEARPLQAAGASALSFSIGAALPVIAAALSPASSSAFVVSAASLVALAGLGALSATAGGARKRKAVVRIVFWGAIAMAATAGVGKLAGAAV
ncbi:MAG: VIT family protein [Alphaproteobacteria bacterium]|nr:VIT family protein [Alphaproteobacteria bacterium]